MANEDKRNDENKFAEQCCDTSCCGGQGSIKRLADRLSPMAPFFYEDSNLNIGWLCHVTVFNLLVIN